jgi:hypothetical protein
MRKVAKPGSEALKELLDLRWNVNYVKKPIIIAVQNVNYSKVDANQGDFVIIRLAPGGETEKPLGNYTYRSQIVPLVVEIRTKVSNQRMHDIKYELRRICYVYKHDIGGFQLVTYLGFTDDSDKTQNYWTGNCRVELSRVGVYALE